MLIIIKPYKGGQQQTPNPGAQIRLQVLSLGVRLPVETSVRFWLMWPATRTFRLH